MLLQLRVRKEDDNQHKDKNKSWKLKGLSRLDWRVAAVRSAVAVVAHETSVVVELVASVVGTYWSAALSYNLQTFKHVSLS
jgi:hypothetical protein